MTSTESTDDSREVWLSGDETIRFVSELFSGPIDPRSTGRTIRLALKYVELSLKVAPNRVKVEDHFPSVSAISNLSYIIGKIFNAINIDYKIQEIKDVELDYSSFAGTRATGKRAYYLTADPKGLKTIDYIVPTA